MPRMKASTTPAVSTRSDSTLCFGSAAASIHNLCITMRTCAPAPTFGCVAAADSTRPPAEWSSGVCAAAFASAKPPAPFCSSRILMNASCSDGSERPYELTPSCAVCASRSAKRAPKAAEADDGSVSLASSADACSSVASGA
eukprot:5579362-Pleurochrysis_carterae.AAC.2